MGRIVITDRSEAKWRKYVTESPDGCWEWTGNKVGTLGYGMLGVGHSGYYRAHRYSWVRHNGPIPDGKHVLHHCDNPPCVRPDHLYLGTAADNARDRASRNRTLHGALNPFAKLTADEAVEIHRAIHSGMTHSQAAAKFGISIATASRIRNARVWRREIESAQGVQPGVERRSASQEGFPWAA